MLTVFAPGFAVRGEIQYKLTTLLRREYILNCISCEPDSITFRYGQTGVRLLSNKWSAEAGLMLQSELDSEETTGGQEEGEYGW